ncbi:DUF1127 domain-containing protein [Pseudogemmobacter sp. W21_MBD1_M6]|uniref:DUF1127 domain-containing protein n=1 Tax=Pseudogemmobacter sp. W21_MBD1_M6 TaxID=3240271 RepID=UPI003F9678AE
MAAFDTTRPLATGSSFGSRLSKFVMNTFAAVATWNDARVTRSSLSKLTDRELDDIGLCRGDIEAIAGSK